MHLLLALFLGLAAVAAQAQELALKETPAFAERVGKGELPPVAGRLPAAPLVADLTARGREIGRPGGEIVTFAPRARDLRYLSVLGYSRLVGYDEKLTLRPDILLAVDNEGERVFTFRLRPGHRWSDGHPFTSEDFRYYWEDIALNKKLSPAGAPDFFMVDGEAPRFEVLDEATVRYSWTKPNPRFLPALAAARDPYIYRPAHYLKRFHAKYTDEAKLVALAEKQKVRSWAALHNRLDEMYDNTNVDLPTLAPWHNTTRPPANRFVFERNPYYHRVDTAGQQLPYLDRVIVDVVASGLFAAKANAGEVGLLARGLSMTDVPVLKEGEGLHHYKTLLWPIARGSEFALYPNLTAQDPVWRALNRDVRFRRALSLAIDRHTLNNALLFGLGVEGNNTVREGSALFTPELRTLWAGYDPAQADRLLDELGLGERNGSGTRLMADGRPLEIVVEAEAEAGQLVDALSLVAEFWREVGIRLLIKSEDRTILRNRIYSGQATMFAWEGFANAIPTPEMVPDFLAPIRQTDSPWPAWGQYAETGGKSGERVDMPEAQKLVELYRAWASTAEPGAKERAWREMLRIHAEQQFTIGTVAGALQPIVVARSVRNVPEEALYSWEPTAMIGVYRPDEFFHETVQQASR